MLILRGVVTTGLAGAAELGMISTSLTWGQTYLFAQAGPLLDTGLTSLLGNVGIMGVLVWHLWYHTTKSYPQMLDRFSQEQERLRLAFDSGQERSRQAFETELSRVRDAHAAHQGRLVDAHEREVARLQGMIDRLQAVFVQSVGEMRRAVHDVRDTAQANIVKTEEIVTRAMNGGHEPEKKKP